VQGFKDVMQLHTIIIEGEGALVNEAGEEIPLKASDVALVNSH